jgi:two-component system nitrogen regulation response regulator NtrX
VAATHRDLEAEVGAGRFREDLYYRLKVIEVQVPPLRERLEDLPALTERFLMHVAERLGRKKKQITEEALARLARHPWRGNVRELRNVIEQAAVLSSGPSIQALDLRLAGSEGSASSDATARPFREAKRDAIESFERAYLIGALRRHGGNVSRTAESIGMVRQSLQQKIRELGLRSDDWNEESE